MTLPIWVIVEPPSFAEPGATGSAKESFEIRALPAVASAAFGGPQRRELAIRSEGDEPLIDGSAGSSPGSRRITP
ncbi:hypothetical protein ABH920_007365 [Catenulispora sp. EB89]